MIFKRISLVSFFLITLIAGKALAHDASWSIDGFVKYENGMQGEYLYQKNANRDIKKLSFLEWEEKPIWIYGINTKFSFDRLNATFLLETAMAKACGKMYDSDWENLNNTKTKYSISENKLSSYLNSNFKIGYDFYPLTWFSIGPTIEAGYKTIGFSAKNGYGWYGIASGGITSAYDSPTATYHPTGTLCGIDYKKQTYYTFIGLKLAADLGSRVHLILEGEASPFAYIQADDTHYTDIVSKNSVKYRDEVQLFFKTYKGSAQAYFDLTNSISFLLNCSALISLETKDGKVSTQTAKNGKFLMMGQQSSGATEVYFQVGTGISIKIF